MHEPPLADEKILQMLLDLAGLGAWRVHRGSGALEWDDRMHSIFGLRPRSFSERQEDFIALIHPQDREAVRRKFSDALSQGGQFSAEYRVIWPGDGSVHVVRSKGQPCDGEAVEACRMAGICWDITESREKEKEGALERHRMSFLMENIPDKVYFKDISGRFIRINTAMRNWFGEDEDAGVIGKTDFGFFADEHARQAFEDEHTIVNTGVPVIHKEEKETCRDGRITWVSTTKLPFRDPEGRIVGTFGASLDITAQKLAEAELLERLEKLRARNAELEEELKRLL